ncbi:cellulase family glycosylhydrolase [bacterium]|nr:cellulase family glycosylhydrolase [bacterium]
MNIFKLIKISVFALIICSLANCQVSDKIKELTDKPSRKPLDRSLIGVNNFFVESGFGSINTQYRDIKSNLKIPYVRVLLAWTDAVQPSPGASPNYSFFDSILNQVPAGVDILPVVVHTPNWMNNPANWIDANPRKTWVERWLKPTVQRYASNNKIVGWEVWNEPDLTVVASDTALGLTDPAKYLELLQFSRDAIKAADPGTQIVIAATQSIQQNYPDHLNYNRTLRDLGARNLVDVWNIHYYGEQFEKVSASGDIADFLNSLNMPIWVTESGQQGPNNQLAYAETTWPFLKDKIPNISRIYYYIYASSFSPVEQNYGLRTSNSSLPVSDLYVHLRDN